MKTIYIAEPGQQPVTYEEDQVHTMWAQGRITAQALYWHEGMPEWRPAGEFFNSNIPGPTPPVYQARRWAKDPTQLTQVLRTFFWILLGLAVVSAMFSILSIATGRAQQTEVETLTPLDIVEILLGLGYLAMYLTTAVIFCMWIHRANRNARALSTVSMKFTPGWCVGWFFIPIMNLWKPMQAMREIWQVSENPQQEPDENTPSLVGTWWTLWILTNFLGQLSIRYTMRASTPNDYLIAEVITLVSDFVDIGLCLVAAKLVVSIYQMQKAQAEGA